MKNSLLLLIVFLTLTPLQAQPSIQWQKTLGGSEYEIAKAVRQTSDGGYITCGYSLSTDGDIIGGHGLYDILVVKFDQLGSETWQKSLGGSNVDGAYDLEQTTDGGYILAGYTLSDDGDVTGFHGYIDAWVIKLDSSGNIQWQKALGGSGWDETWSVGLTNDGGYILAGRSNSEDGDVGGTHDNTLDYWLVKLDNGGSIQWQKTYGGSDEDVARSIRQTSDGGYIATGNAKSVDGDVVGNKGNVDFWVLKLDHFGNLEWQKPLGGAGLDVGCEIHELSDGYIACGFAGSIDGDVTGYHGFLDGWVLKLSKTGELLWQNAVGGSQSDWLFAGTPTPDGGYVAVGTTISLDGDITYHNGQKDLWIVKLNADGELLWQKCLGGSFVEGGESISTTSDGGLVVAGYAYSTDGDLTENKGIQDIWVVKLSPESVGVASPVAFDSKSLEIFPNPAQQAITIRIPETTAFQVSILDIQGREVLRQGVGENGALDISMLCKGIYLALVRGESGEMYSGKFVKE